MVAPCPLPCIEELKKYYEYLPETGELFLKKARCMADKQKVGKPIGSLGGPSRRKTWMIKHKGKSYYISRIAWFLMTGTDPGLLLIDHKNRNAQDNRWDNLRLANETENNYNKIFVGYCKRKDNNLFRVRVTLENKRITIGNFKTEEEAKKAAADAQKIFYREFACLDLE
jgi:hypothetical protein